MVTPQIIDDTQEEFTAMDTPRVIKQRPIFRIDW